jgi:quercetin dioxygenase-like cupin family protein
MSSRSVSAQRIVALTPQAGEPWWWFGGLALIKLASSQTEGRFSLIEMLWPPNLEVPLHVHTREDELFHVLEGTISYRIGDSRSEASPGHSVFAPRNIPHGFTVTSPPRALSDRVLARRVRGICPRNQRTSPRPELTPRPSGPIDPAQLEKIAAMMASKYGCSFVR